MKLQLNTTNFNFFSFLFFFFAIIVRFCSFRIFLQGFQSGFANELKGVNVLFMQSDGGLTQMNR